jgi:hypothetical protein
MALLYVLKNRAWARACKRSRQCCYFLIQTVRMELVILEVNVERPMSKRKADAISNGFFLVGIGVLVFTNAWWPGILVVLWATLAVRQFLTGRLYDLIITSLILLGLTFVTWMDIDLWVIVPVLLVLGGIHIIFREYSMAEGLEEEPLDEQEREIEDDTQPPK